MKANGKVIALTSEMPLEAVERSSICQSDGSLSPRAGPPLQTGLSLNDFESGTE